MQCFLSKFMQLEKMGALAHLNQLLFTEMNYSAVFK